MTESKNPPTAPTHEHATIDALAVAVPPLPESLDRALNAALGAIPAALTPDPEEPLGAGESAPTDDVQPESTQPEDPARVLAKKRLWGALRTGRLRGAVACDLETVPLASSLALPYRLEDRDVPQITKTGKYRSQEDLDAWIAADMLTWQRQRLKGYSTDPRLGRIVSVGVAVTSDMARLELPLKAAGTMRGAGVAPTEADEAALITNLWNTLAVAERVVTFAGQFFDLPFLIIRSLLLDVEVPDSIEVPKLLVRYRSAPHMDVSELLANWSPQRRASLEDWAAAFGFPPKLMHGDEVFDAYVAERWDLLAEYPQQDALLSLALAQRLASVYW
jgi:predicted PolB exonuclease-like 3'-5' exonuclease